MKNRTTAALLAFLLGGVGAHKFYLGRALMGLAYLFFCWTFIPAFLGFIEGIVYLTMSDADFNLKYNGGMVLAGAQPQNIVVNVANTAQAGGGGVSERLRSLHDLKASGALTSEEYEAQKQKVLAAG